MANHHFGNVGDVWKHLALAEVLALERPSWYTETHAGSGSYAMVDDPERRFDVLRFLEVADTTASLRHSRYRALLSQFGDARSIYPGSALMAMAELGVGTSYLLCDLDAASVDDLRDWSTRLGIPRCEVVQADGMTTVLAQLEARTGPSTAGRVVVHIDPFNPHSHRAGGPSSLDLATRIADEGIGLVYWYCCDTPDERFWAYHTLSRRTHSPLWCGDVMVADETGAGRPGRFGRDTTPGTGCGIILANVSEDTRTTCRALGEALALAYGGSTLPDGTRGRIVFSVREDL